MTRWDRFHLWLNRKFRPLAVTKPDEFILVKVSDISCPCDEKELEAFAVEALASQIEASGEVGVPIAVNVGRMLVAGKYRLAAVKRLRWTHIPCRVVNAECVKDLIDQAIAESRTRQNA